MMTTTTLPQRRATTRGTWCDGARTVILPTAVLSPPARPPRSLTIRGRAPNDMRRAATQARVTAHAVHHLGLRTVGLILANSARRGAEQTRSGSASRARRRPGVSRAGWSVSRCGTPDPGTALFHFERARLEVAFLAADVVRVSWGPGPGPVPYAIDGGRLRVRFPTSRPIPSTCCGADGAWVLRSDALEVTVLPDGSLRTARPGGAVLRSESAPARRGPAWEQSFSMRAGERMCGLGEQVVGHRPARRPTSSCGTPTRADRGAREEPALPRHPGPAVHPPRRRRAQLLRELDPRHLRSGWATATDDHAADEGTTEDDGDGALRRWGPAPLSRGRTGARISWTATAS